MILAILASAAVQAVPPPPGIPTPPAPQVVSSFGVAKSSCAELVGFSSVTVEGWVLGYWSGMNAANDHRSDVGAGLNDQGILALVRAQCVSRKQDLNSAAFAAYEIANALGE